MTIQKLSGDERVTVPGHLLSPRGGDHYVLRVVGNSMIDEAIMDGDFVICLRREAAEAGEMAVVLVGDESSIKRVYPEGRMVRPQPANPLLPAIRLPAEDVQVKGIVVGMMRKF